MLSFIQLFQEFLQKNITVTIVIISVLLVRLLIRKFPKKYSYILWSFVGIRMMFDISVSSRISLFTLLNVASDKLRNIFKGKSNTVTEWTGAVSENTGNVFNAEGTVNMGGVDIGGNQMNPPIKDGFSTIGEINTEMVSVSTGDIVLTVLSVVWIIGIAALLCYGVISYVKCKKMVRQAVLAEGNIWECDRISSPFVLGIISPQIYIPFHLEEDEKKYILAHENCHIRRRDYLTKLLAFCLLAVYWINPFVWVAFHLMSRDMEMSCDEAVLEKFGVEIKKAYSVSLLNEAAGRKRYSFAPIAFGEADAGKRIKNVLRFRKPKVWLTVLLLLLIAVVGIASLTNAEKKEEIEENGELNDTNDKEIVESVEISPELQEIYMEAINRLANENVFPNGEMAEPDEALKVENMYYIGDVDGDERAELIINYPYSNAMAGMSYYIFDYDEERGEFKQELAEFPAVTIYDNGIVLAEASHNHGRSNMDDFWPYNVYEYKKNTDTYEHLAFVDAWQYILYEGAEPDADFPHEADTDGDGVLYYWADKNTFEPTNIMDKEAYEKWKADLTANAGIRNMEYERLPVETDKLEVLWESHNLDMDGNGVNDYASLSIQRENNEYRNIVNILLDDGSGWEKEYPGRTGSKEDFMTVDSDRLHYTDRDSIVLGITDSTSNYGSTDFHILSMIGEGESAKLVEELTVLDGMTASPQYDLYKESMMGIDAVITITEPDDLVKYVDELETNALQINDYESDRIIYVYWNGNSWDAIEMDRR